VDVIYLNPIFEAASNHRYDTGDYMKIDPILGGEADFRRLCEKAGARGMHVLLDGVFNHTGSDSRYFNRKGLYDGIGAAQSQDSPYYHWYKFRCWPDDYACWWGVKSLPETDKSDEGFIRFSLEGEDSVVKRWLRAGASGWRLDVADELPRAYVERLRAAVKAEQPDAVVIGEVWEDASAKTSYGVRRRYLMGRELDGVMNYPAREAVVGFVTGKINAAEAAGALMTLHEHYPAPSRRCMMNLLGTHDIARILTVLGCDDAAFALPRMGKAAYRLSAQEYAKGKAGLRLASALQYMLPGSPCLYYGDEAGLAGFEDPLNRRCYPWGNEDGDLLAWYRALGTMRRQYRRLFQQGALEIAPLGDGALRICRCVGEERIVAVVNRGDAPLQIDIGQDSKVIAGEGCSPLPPGGVTISVNK
jgi:cyclomaltodextrinase